MRLNYGIIDFCALDENDYRKFLIGRPAGINFAQYEWLKCFNGYSSFRVECIVAKDANSIVGIFPYVIRKKYGVTLYESMPYSLYGGIVSSINSFDGILECFEKEVLARSGLYDVRIIFGDSLSEKAVSTLKTFGYAMKKGKAAVVSLDKNLDAIFKSYKHSIRKNIKKAIREDVIVSEIQDEQELYEFYKMAKYIYEYHNDKMPYSYELYRHIFKHLVPAGIANFCIAKRYGDILAGSVHFYDYYAKEVFNWLTPSYRKYQQYRANTLLIHHVLMKAAEKGFTWYNLGASPDGEEGLLRFKHNWGALDREYMLCSKQSKLLEIYKYIKRTL